MKVKTFSLIIRVLLFIYLKKIHITHVSKHIHYEKLFHSFNISQI